MTRLKFYLSWWWRSVKSTRCRHTNVRGFANMPGTDGHAGLQALQCEDCTMVIIEIQEAT